MIVMMETGRKSRVDVGLKENERIDDLQCKGLRIIQNTKGFCFGVDAVLLSDFAVIKKNSRVLDLGTGTGIIPILLAGKTEAGEITGLEIQEGMAEMAARSIVMNGLEKRVKIQHGDICIAEQYFGQSNFDVVITNPPYMNKGGGLLNPADAKAISRHEILCTLEDVVRTGSRMLNTSGKFFMIHRPERLADIICLMRKYAIETKRLRFIHPDSGKKPSMVLVEGAKGGNAYLNVDKPLYIFNPDGTYTDEIDRIYGRGEYKID